MQGMLGNVLEGHQYVCQDPVVAPPWPPAPIARRCLDGFDAAAVESGHMMQR